MRADNDPNENELDSLRRSAAQASSDARRDPYPLMLRELLAELSDWTDRLEHAGVSSTGDRFALREALLRAMFELQEANPDIPWPDDDGLDPDPAPAPWPLPGTGDHDPSGGRR